MTSFTKEYIKAILAGVMIGLSGFVYLSVENKIIGSFLFSFGLITILSQGWSLYTGKIGYITKNTAKYIPVWLFGNYIGTYFVAVGAQLTNPVDIYQQATILCQAKLLQSWPAVLTLSILCGIMMMLAVDGYRHTLGSHLILVIMPIMIFILSGFEHSIANMFYYNLASVWSWKAVGYIFINIVGNAVGALIIQYFNKETI
jgi:formate transporter